MREGVQGVREPSTGLHNSLGLSRDFLQTRLSRESMFVKWSGSGGPTVPGRGNYVQSHKLEMWLERGEPERLDGAGSPTNSNEETHQLFTLLSDYTLHDKVLSFYQSTASFPRTSGDHQRGEQYTDPLGQRSQRREQPGAEVELRPAMGAARSETRGW